MVISEKKNITNPITYIFTFLITTIGVYRSFLSGYAIPPRYGQLNLESRNGFDFFFTKSYVIAEMHFPDYRTMSFDNALIYFKF